MAKLDQVLGPDGGGGKQPVARAWKQMHKSLLTEAIL